jgi:L-aspartate semialdehyde sulfurtransferase ferredoxin
MSDTATKKLMLTFPRWERKKPIIYHLVKDHNLVVNVYRAQITPEAEGHLVLDMTGTKEDIKRGMDFIRTFDVTINETGKGVMRDADNCTHCGHCVVHCPTGALFISDTRTREVGYDETDCIECLACIRVCPYGACSSAF